MEPSFTVVCKPLRFLARRLVDPVPGRRGCGGRGQRCPWETSAKSALRSRSRRTSSNPIHPSRPHTPSRGLTAAASPRARPRRRPARRSAGGRPGEAPALTSARARPRNRRPPAKMRAGSVRLPGDGWRAGGVMARLAPDQARRIAQRLMRAQDGRRRWQGRGARAKRAASSASRGQIATSGSRAHHPITGAHIRAPLQSSGPGS